MFVRLLCIRSAFTTNWVCRVYLRLQSTMNEFLSIQPVWLLDRLRLLNRSFGTYASVESDIPRPLEDFLSHKTR